MRVNLRGKYYNVVFRNLQKCDGECSSPSLPNKTIKIATDITDLFRLIEIINHEGLHALLWDLDEEAISEIAKDLTTLLVKTIKKLNKEGKLKKFYE